MLSRSKDRDGARRAFTLIEVLVTIMLVATLTAVIVPTVRGRLREGYEAGLISELDNLATGINAYKQNVGHYPPSLDYLNAIPTGGTDACSPANALTATQLANFRGPYTSRSFSTATYVFGGDDTINVVMARVTGALYANGPTGTMLQIYVDGVDSLTADDIDQKVDGASDRNYGTILWAPRNTYTRLTYQIPMRSGTC